MSAAAVRLSVQLQRIAAAIDKAVVTAAGQPVAWVIVMQTDGVAQYVSNTTRSDGAALIQSLIDRWDAGQADIPAHHNPDLPPAPRPVDRSERTE